VWFRNGHYVELLKHFRPLLQQWWDKYHPISVPGLLHDLLLVEYHFVCIYINSVTLQAIAARTTGETNSSLRHPFEIDDHDSSSVREIVDGCTAILQIVLRLSDANQLKYIPNRVSVRIASAAMYLVKALAIGVQADELNSSLNLLDRSLEALGSASVDDMHLMVNYATLLASHMRTLRNRFVCVSNIVATDISRAPSSFEPLLPFSPDLTSPSNLTDSGNSDIDRWMVLPFDPSIAEPFEQGITQNIFGLNMRDSVGSFWDFLP
jgi:hypothetical protein